MKRRFWWNPWTLMLLLVGASILSLTAALFTADRIGEAIIDQQANAAASAEADYIVTLAREEGLATLVATMNRRERIHGGAGFRYALTDANGRPLAGATDFNGLAHQAKGWKVVVSPGKGKQKVWHVLVGALPTGESFYIAQDSAQRSAFRAAIVRASAIALFFMFLASTAAGLLLSGYLLRRANAVSRTAGLIAAGDLTARVEVSSHGDVFDRLGESLNSMLGRIEELMTGMRTITDSLAHDMRRPLTYVLYALDKAAAPNQSEDQRADAIAGAREHAAGALATFSALLDVARAESGVSRETMSSVDVAKILTDVADLFEPLIEEAGQRFSLEVPVTMTPLRAHEPLLRQAVGNLLYNASQYAGQGARISMTAVPLAGGVDIVVADTGPGIAEADRERVKERFVRLDSARTSAGSGLGLAIASACAKLHGGVLLLEDNKPGLRATLQLRVGVPDSGKGPVSG